MRLIKALFKIHPSKKAPHQLERAHHFAAQFSPSRVDQMPPTTTTATTAKATFPPADISPREAQSKQASPAKAPGS